MRIYLPIAFVLTLSPQALSQTPPANEALCRACHGAKGGAPIAPNYPKLNGQNRAYLISALKAYKTGKRQGGLATLMSAQAKALNDGDMETLAAYYASQISP